ncbi:iron-containing alcohol dehydrogenase [Ruegeria marina]|uniref:Uncharacterized protein n=1 Tax=Ruegeria marina TaxID=639004 RepID=A0A1G6ZKC7_9RHOB|nr:iron-containing alcohol dehydrogenase [Ruegeria marina]SDE02882.1 hypothetical protein SAMN04488239_11316 [Ruegeria marina]
MQTVFQINVPTSVRFGTGAIQALRSLLPAHPGLVLLVRGASAETSKPVRDVFEASGIAFCQVQAQGEPTIASVNAAFSEVAPKDVSAIVACGGGSVLDTAKALRFCIDIRSTLPDDLSALDAEALNRPSSLPLIAIPTTAGTGAEVTCNAVLGTATSKTSIRGQGLYPDVALVDPSVMSSAPKHVILGAGLDAVTQTIEAYTSCKSTPFTNALTEPNVRIGPQALRAVVERGDVAGWNRIAWVSLSSGLALSNGGLGAAHGLAAVLGARLGAPHGLLCGRLLGPVLLRNRAGAERGSDTFRKLEACIGALADAFPSQDMSAPLSGFDAWLQTHQVPRLRDYGAEVSRFDTVAEAAVFASSSTKNAVPLKTSDFREILDAAF